MSDKSQSPRKTVKKVVKGPVAVRKKKPTAEYTGSLQSAWNYVLVDVLLPAARDMFYDAIVAGSGKMIYQEDRPRTHSPRGRAVGKSHNEPYHRYSGNKHPVNDPEEPRQMTRRARANHDFSEIILNSRQEADDVLDSLFEHLLEYDVVTVSDLYDMVGITPKYTDDDWGWTDIRGSNIRRTRQGYLLELPQPTPLD